MEGDVPDWFRDAVSKFGEDCKLKLAGPGDREAAIRAPLEGGLQRCKQSAAQQCKLDRVSDLRRRSKAQRGRSS